MWERGGCPKGGDATYYERARALVGMEDNPQSGQIDVEFAPHVEAAAMRDNRGEFPSRFTDHTRMVARPGDA